MKRLSIFTSLFLLMACNSPGTQHEHHEDHSHEAHQHSEGVALDHGKKWNANPETTEGIHQMRNLVEDFEPSDTRSYASLQKDLQNQYDQIIQQCTMEGEAHQQLHNYLMPLKEEIDRLSEKNLPLVKKHLHNYDEYFKTS